MSARHSAPPSVRMFLLQLSPCGQYRAAGALKLPSGMPYSCSLPGSVYGPNTWRSTPILP